MKFALFFALCFAASGIMAQQQQFVTIPCNCPTSEVRFVYDPDVITGVAMRSVYLGKTEKRRSFEDLTARERRKLQRQAHRMHACEILVFDRYRPSGFTPEAEAENQALFGKAMLILMVQRSRPCPECCPPEERTSMR
jgi:hypothetical protein